MSGSAADNFARATPAFGEFLVKPPPVTITLSTVERVRLSLPRRRVTGTLVGVALIASTAGILAHSEDGASAASASEHCGPAYGASVRAWEHRRDAVFDASNGSRVVAFLGDSYTQGVIIDSLTEDYAVVAARRLGWRPWLAGRGGTGYVNGGPCGGGAAYGTRVADAISRHPDVVVIEGSINDWRSRPGTITEAARMLYRDVHAAAPYATIVALGPCRVPKIPRDRVDAIDAALRSAASASGVRYVSELTWIDAPGLVVPDGMHPTAAGHAVIGGRLAAALQPLTG